MSHSWTGLFSHRKRHSVWSLSSWDKAILCLQLIFIIYKIIKCLNANVKYHTGNMTWYLFYVVIPLIQKANFRSFWGPLFQGFRKYYMLAVTFCSSLVPLLKYPFMQLYCWEVGGRIPCEFWMFWHFFFFVLWIPNVQAAHWRCSPLHSGYLYELVILTSWSFFCN